MPIDIHAEELCTLVGATQLLPKVNRNPLHANAIWRWCRRGVRGVHLEHVRIGGRIFTSAQALNRFANALAAADMDRLKARSAQPAPAPALPPISVSQRSAYRPLTAAEAAAHRAAEEELDGLGL